MQFFKNIGSATGCAMRETGGAIALLCHNVHGAATDKQDLVIYVRSCVREQFQSHV